MYCWEGFKPSKVPSRQHNAASEKLVCKLLVIRPTKRKTSGGDYSQLQQHRTGDRRAGWEAGEAKGTEDVGRGQEEDQRDAEEELGKEEGRKVKAVTVNSTDSLSVLHDRGPGDHKLPTSACALPGSDLRMRGHFGSTLEQAKGGSELVSATETMT